MILAVAALLTVGAVVFTLLIRPRDIHEEPPATPVDHLEERKQLIYDNLRDLQFEHRVGKLSESDYQKSKLELQKQLARIMEQIDAAQGGVKPGKKVSSPAPVAPAPAHKCPHCGAEFERPMKFCGECGQPMKDDTA